MAAFIMAQDKETINIDLMVPTSWEKLNEKQLRCVRADCARFRHAADQDLLPLLNMRSYSPDFHDFSWLKCAKYRSVFRKNGILAEYNPKKYTNPLAFLDNMIIFAPEIQRLTSWLKKKSYSRS